MLSIFKNIKLPFVRFQTITIRTLFVFVYVQVAKQVFVIAHNDKRAQRIRVRSKLVRNHRNCYVSSASPAPWRPQAEKIFFAKS